MGSRRRYGPGIRVESTLGYACTAAMARTRDTVAANHQGYSFFTSARIPGAKLMKL